MKKIILGLSLLACIPSLHAQSFQLHSSDIKQGGAGK